MSFRRWVARLDLVAVLLVVTVLELVLNRLAVEVLRPSSSEVLTVPPGWHRNLDFVGLFTFHLASILALAVGIWTTIELLRRDDLFSWPARLTIAIVGQVFFLFAGWSVFARAPESLSFHLETAFMVLLVLTWLALVLRPGDRFVKVGLLVLVVPFALHYYSTFAVRFLADEAARSSLPERVREWGQLWIAFGAVAVQVCFAPRPWQRHVLRAGPLVIAGFVGTVAAVVMRRHYAVGMELASRGLGIELGPAAPLGLVAAYVLAAAATAWTLASTLTAESPARRRIGMGFALIACGGYAFAWPLQFLSAFVGALAIAQGGARVQAEEQAQSASPAPPRRRAPAIGDATWRAYATALSRAIAADEPRLIPRGPIEETTIGGIRGSMPFALSIQRSPQGVVAIDMLFGLAPPADRPPDLTLLARPEGALYAPHPAPPPTDAPTARTSDAAFDRRFRAQDRGGLLARCLDDALRARATALLDGWIAVWPGRALRYRVCPGRGAPLDHPIPIPSLALGVEDVASTTERLVRVFDLLEEIAERAVAPGPADAAQDAPS
jgi:hypothetical protein